MTTLRIGHGYDLHRLTDGSQLVIGGIKIEHAKQVVAHSDGDVVLHALCDALLGSLALSDIGQHFPDNDPNYKGIESAVLVQRVLSLVEDKGYAPVNVDMTILAEKPKLSPHIPKMRTIIAELLKLSYDRVGIKATTSEKVGPIGREEAIAAYAVVLCDRRQ